MIEMITIYFTYIYGNILYVNMHMKTNHSNPEYPEYNIFCVSFLK